MTFGLCLIFCNQSDWPVAGLGIGLKPEEFDECFKALDRIKNNAHMVNDLMYPALVLLRSINDGEQANSNALLTAISDLERIYHYENKA